MQGRTGDRPIGECSTTELPRPLQLHHIHIGKKSGGKPTTTKLRAFSASRYRTLKGIHFNVILGTPLPIDLCKQLKMHDLTTGFKIPVNARVEMAKGVSLSIPDHFKVINVKV